MQFFFSILLIFYVVPSLAQDNPAKFLTRFPFTQYNGGVMLIKARLENVKDSFNFILDTGSSGISLDSATCSEKGIKPTATDSTVLGMGGAFKVNYVFNKSLYFPGLAVERLNFHVNNYDILTSVYGEKIDGIIGSSFFNRYIVKINFDSSFIEVFTPGEIKYEKGGTVLYPNIQGIPRVEFIIKDAKSIAYKYLFDTGAGLCLLMSEAFVRNKDILKAGRKLFYTQAEGLGGKLQMRLTVIKMLQIGKYKFHNIPVYIYDDIFNVTAYPRTGGLLGNDLLRRFNLTLNYPKGEIYLKPNNQFRDPFDYAYTGLGIYYENGNIFIEDIVPGSPGEKAGIKSGDILIGLANNFTNDIRQYKALLQSATKKTKIVVRRGAELIELSISPRSIL